MAKKSFRINKSTTAEDQDIPEVDPVEETAETAEETPEVEDIKVQPVVPEPVVQINVPVAAVAPVRPDKVRISVFVTLDPAPRVGQWSFSKDLGIAVLKPGLYEVPYDVGVHLVDKKIAQFA